MSGVSLITLTPVQALVARTALRLQASEIRSRKHCYDEFEELLHDTDKLISHLDAYLASIRRDLAIEGGSK